MAAKKPAAQPAASHASVYSQIVDYWFILLFTLLDAPVSLADVTPTILRVLRINAIPNDENHGRVLEELLNTGPNSNLKTSHRTAKASAASYEASIDIS